jgi:hypothetical protein
MSPFEAIGAAQPRRVAVARAKVRRRLWQLFGGPARPDAGSVTALANTGFGTDLPPAELLGRSKAARL